MKSKTTVGYKRPPRHTQFKPGQSGNPNGRPKGTRNLDTDLEEELSEKIVVNEGGRRLEISKQRSILKSLVSKALKGDTRAASILVNLKLGLEQSKPVDDRNSSLDADDQAILEAYARRLLDAEKHAGT